MRILEFGNVENPKIILIHGFQCPYQVWNEYIAHYIDRFHMIVPVMTGHNPDEKEEFTSFEKCAEYFEEYYTSRYGNDVYAIYGMSMGGVFACHLWQSEILNIKKLIIESSPLLKYNKLLAFIMGKTYLMLTHKTQQRDIKTIKKAENSIVPKGKLKEFLEVLDNMSDSTIERYNIEIAKFDLLPDIDTKNTEIFYYHGTRINEMLAKKTARYLCRNYQNSQIICFKGKGHCEDALLNPDKMIKELDKIII